MSLQDETGSGRLEFQKFTPEMHVQQLLIDLRQAREENKQLRGDLEDLIEMHSEKGSVLFSFIAGVAVTLIAHALFK